MTAHAVANPVRTKKGGIEVEFDLDDLSAKRLLLMSLLWPSSLDSGELQQLAFAAVSLFEVEARRGPEQQQPLPDVIAIRKLHS